MPLTVQQATDALMAAGWPQDVHIPAPMLRLAGMDPADPLKAVTVPTALATDASVAQDTANLMAEAQANDLPAAFISTLAKIGGIAIAAAK